MERADLLVTIEKALAKRPRKRIFTRSFDRHATAIVDEQLLSSRLEKVRKIGLKKPDGGLKGGKGGATASRKSLSVLFGTTLSPLLGRNAFAYLERHFMDKTFRSQVWHGLPTWVKASGTVMGEGALAGANLLAGEIKNYNNPPVSVADLIRGFESGTVSIKRLRRLIQEKSILEQLHISRRLEQLRADLVAAGNELLTCSHTELEFLLCEISKIIDFARTLQPNRRYLRHPAL